MAAPIPGPFQVGTPGLPGYTNLMDPMSYGLEQYNYEMSQANQGGYDAGSDALAQAIAQQQAAGQADTAPSMEGPFPKGGLLGALAGIAAGAGGLMPQLLQHEARAKAINLRQEGFLKLRQADRDKTIAGLQMKQAGLDADYEQTMAKLRAETNMDQARIHAQRLNQIRKDKAARNEAMSKAGKDTWAQIQEPLVNSMMTGTFLGGELRDDRTFEIAKQYLEGQLATIPEEFRGGLLSQAMGMLSTGREFSIQNAPVPVVDDPNDRTLGEAFGESGPAGVGELFTETGRSAFQVIDYITAGGASKAFGSAVPGFHFGLVGGNAGPEGPAEAVVGRDVPLPAGSGMGADDQGYSQWFSEAADPGAGPMPVLPQGAPMGLNFPEYQPPTPASILPQMDVPSPPVVSPKIKPDQVRFALGFEPSDPKIKGDIAKFITDLGRLFNGTGPTKGKARMAERLQKIEDRLDSEGIDGGAWLEANLPEGVYRGLRSI